MKRLITSLLFLLCFTAYSQTIPFKHYGVEDGLGNSIAYHVFQDSKGYLWFSTDHGLSKFDGLHFTNYTTADGLPTNYIMAVTETTDGVLWIATYEYGVYTYEKGKFMSHPPDKSLGRIIPINITSDSQNRVWLFSRQDQSRYIWYIKNNKYKKFSINDYTKDTVSYIFHDVFVRADGTPLFATDKGVFALKGDKLTSLIGSDYSIYIMDEDNVGNLWLGAVGKIIEYSADSKIRILTNDLIKDKQVRILRSDCGDKLWVGQFPHQLFAIHTTDGKTVFREDLPVNLIFRDRENDIWVITFGQGAFCYNYQDIINYTVQEGLADNIIMGIAEDSKGKIWVGSLRGVSYLNEIGSGKFGAETYTKQDEINGFTIDNKDDILYGYERGLAITKDGKRTEIPLKKRVRSLYKDMNGKIWIAMYKGIAYYQNDSVFHPKELSVLNDKKCNTIRLDSHGNLWVGTSEGVYCYNGKTVVKYSTGEGLSNNVVNGIWEDTKNRIWLATEEGINLLDNGKLVSDSLLKGLSNTMCTSLIGDATGKVWIGTNHGLFVDDGHSIRKFDQRTGLTGIEIQSLYVDSKNYLWVGSITGLTGINLNMYARIINSYPPPVYIQNIRVSGNNLGMPDSTLHSFSHSDNNIRISYTGLCFKNPQSLLYEYKLSGASGTWTKTASTSVEFSSLSPGQYNFLVRAVNTDGLYSKVPAGFSFTIQPPFWMTPWFIVLDAIIFIAIVSIIFRWRVRRSKQKALLKEELLNAKKTLENYMISMVEKNELLEQFKMDIEKLKQLKAKEIDEVRVDQLEHLNKTTILTDEDWDKFKKLFEQVHKGYFIRLKEKLPDLTQAEIRLMCLSKLKLDTKQIIEILGVSLNTVKSLRHRLRKKLNLSEEDSLYDLSDSI